MPDLDLRREFDRQVENLLLKGYPKLGGLEDRDVLRHVAPLEERLVDLPTLRRRNSIPFVIVVSGRLLRPAVAIEAVELGGKQGFTHMTAADLARFAPLPELDLPRAPAYLMADVDTGGDTLGVTPDDALQTTVRNSRSPLTIEEGVALVTHFPEVLERNNCFSILGSRCGDRRVTAIWISGRRPRLGWCWAGHAHTWLGSASCASRLGL